MKRKLITNVLFALVILVSSCTISKPYRTPVASTRGLYRDMPSTDTSNMANLHWTEIFGDTLLQNLIREGIAHNLDLKSAYSHIQQARAYFEQSRLAFLPNISTYADAQMGKLSNTTTNNTHSYLLAATASWEADLWGKLKSSRRASLASMLQTEAYSRVVQTDLVAGIANYYYTLLALDQELEITQQSVENWISTVDIMKSLKDADVVISAAFPPATCLVLAH